MNIVASPATRGLSPEVSSTRLSQVDFYLTCRSTCCFHQEIRTQDYLKAYTATGRPPAPVPQEPVGETERAGLGLPPLFQPHVEGGGSDTLSTGPVAEASNPPASPAHQSRIMDHSKLPRIPQFRPVIENDEDTYHNISAMPDYSFFSNEASTFMFYISKIYILYFLIFGKSRNYGCLHTPRGSYTPQSRYLSISPPFEYQHNHHQLPLQLLLTLLCMEQQLLTLKNLVRLDSPPSCTTKASQLGSSSIDILSRYVHPNLPSEYVMSNVTA